MTTKSWKKLMAKVLKLWSDPQKESWFCFVSAELRKPRTFLTLHYLLSDDADSRKAENLLEVMEQIDDDCAKRGIAFVKVSEEGAAEQHGVARLPSLVFFKSDLPTVYEGIVPILTVASNHASLQPPTVQQSN